MKPLLIIVGLIEFILRLSVFAAMTLTILPLIIFICMTDDCENGDESGFHRKIG